MKDIQYLDLFSGAGGFSCGLRSAGLKTAAAIEIDRFAVDTYKHNFPDTKVYKRDIKTFSNEEIVSSFYNLDLIVGGPPCQGFSVAGPYKFGILDDRNNLVLEMFRFVKLLSPNMVVIENVGNFKNGTLSSKHNVVQALFQLFNDHGYETKIETLKAQNFGVPQMRTRVFIFGIKKDSGLSFPIINTTHGSGKKPYTTVNEALNDLPQINAGEGYDNSPEKFEYEKVNLSSYQTKMRNGSKGIYNHEAMKHTERLIKRFKHIPQGGSLLDVPKEHGQRLRNGDELDKKPRFKMNNQRLNPADISTCITASFQSTFVHPYLDRNLTAREGARLQSFPDSFIFKGPRTLMSKKLLIRENREDEIGLSQYNQIGNSVPPLLAECIGNAIYRSFKELQDCEN